MKFLTILLAALITVSAITTKAGISITNGLAAYYPFNGNANDASGNGLNGPQTNLTFAIDRFGATNSCIAFNGTNSLTVTNFFANGSNTYTFSLWFRPKTDITYSNYIGQNYIPGKTWSVNPFTFVENSPTTDYAVGLINIYYNENFFDGNYQWNSGGIFVDFISTLNSFGGCENYISHNNNGDLYNDSVGAFAIADESFSSNQWYNVLVEFDGTSVSTFINSQLVAQQPTITSDPYYSPINFSSIIHSNLLVGNAFIGYMDDLAVFTRALTPTEVNQLYTNSVPSPAAPSVLQNPQDQGVNYNSNATFSVIAAGTLPIYYQWLFNGSLLPNANANTVTLNSITTTNLGTYSLILSNAFGVVTSSAANLYMYPKIVSPFKGAIAYWGIDSTLSVGAVGSALNYQWYFNGAAISGATNSTLYLPTIQFTNAGLYNVVVSSIFGGVTNATCQVIVNPANVSIGTCPEIYISGKAGYSYTIQCSTNLTDNNSWVTVTNITLSSASLIWGDFSTDLTKLGLPQKFYRVIAGQ